MSPEDLTPVRGSTPGKPRVTVEEDAECAYCGAHGTVIFAYDESVYGGGACALCVRDGKASATYEPEHKVMAPMLFLANALLGIEPFATIKANADAQRAEANRATRKQSRKKPRERKRARQRQSKSRKRNR